MQFLFKIFIFLIGLSAAYMLLVFGQPKLADSIEATLGFSWVNTQIREFKSKLDNVGNPTNTGSLWSKLGNIGDLPNVITDTKDRIERMASGVERISATLDQKATELNQTIENVKQVGESVTELKNSVNKLMNIGSGSTGTALASTASVSTQNGSIESQIFWSN